MQRSRNAMRPPDVQGSLQQFYTTLITEEWRPLSNCNARQLTEEFHVVENNLLKAPYF